MKLLRVLRELRWCQLIGRKSIAQSMLTAISSRCCNATLCPVLLWRNFWSVSLPWTCIVHFHFSLFQPCQNSRSLQGHSWQHPATLGGNACLIYDWSVVGLLVGCSPWNGDWIRCSEFLWQKPIWCEMNSEEVVCNLAAGMHDPVFELTRACHHHRVVAKIQAEPSAGINFFC